MTKDLVSGQEFLDSVMKMPPSIFKICEYGPKTVGEVLPIFPNCVSLPSGPP